MRPVSSELPLTTSTFSMRCLCSSACTSSFEAPSRTVTSWSRGVITAETGASSCVSKRRSRCVTMPTAFLPSTTGTPEMPLARVSCSTWRMVMSGDTEMGSRMTPASCFFTLATSAACSSMLMFLWMMPMPPSCAMVMARRASVTVSMAEESMGRPSRTDFVSCVPRSISLGRTSEAAGTSRTSSKVSASSRISMANSTGEVRGR